MPLDPNKFTRKTGEALGAAQALARERNHSQVTPEHLLAALLSQPESVVLPVLERVGVAAATVRNRVEDAICVLLRRATCTWLCTCGRTRCSDRPVSTI